ncbi:MAG: response regulator [Gemmatimonadales bacterium]
MSVSKPGRSRGRNRTRVLVVSHDAIVRAEIQRTLRAQGLDVTAVGDAFEALAALARLNGSAASIRIAIVDTYLPGFSGWDLLRYLRISLPGTPLLRLEVAGTDVPLEFATLDVSVLTKPVRPSGLLSAMRRLLTSPGEWHRGEQAQRG